MAVRQTKRISELTALTSASLDTTVVGVDNGVTYKIELDTLADAVTSRVNILDRSRLSSLESSTSSFESKGRSVISSSAQITALGFVSSSTNINSLNTFTSSYLTDSASFNTRIIAATNEQSFNGLISGSSQLTSSYDQRYVLSGSITQTTWDNISGKPSGLVSQSTDLSSLNNFTASFSTASLVNRLTSIENVTSSYETMGRNIVSGSSQLTSSFDVRYTLSGSIVVSPNTISSSAQITSLGFISSSTPITSLNTYTASNDTKWSTLGGLTGSYLTSLNGSISSSNQLTTSFDTRYAPSASYLTSLNGAISSSIQVLGGSGVISSSTQIDTLFNLDGVISGSSQITSLGFISSSTPITSINSFTSSYNTGSFTGSFTGSIRGNINLYQGNTIRLYNTAETGYGQISFIDADDKLQLQRGIQPSADNYWDLGRPGRRVNVVYASTFSGSIAATNGVISGSSQLTSSLDTIYLTIGGDNVISGSSQLTASLDNRYALSGSGGSIPGGTISGSSQLTSSYDSRYELQGRSVVSGSSQLTSSYDGRYTLTSSFNSFTASAQAVTTGSNSFNGTQTITGSLIVTTGSFVGSTITANTSSLYLTSGSNVYVQNNGLVEITGSLTISGSNNTSIISPVLMVGTGSGDEGGEILLAKAATNTTLNGSGITIDSYRDKIRIFEQGGDARGVSIDISKAPTGVGGELIWKVSGFVNAGTFLTLDNIKATVTSSGQRGLSVATVSGTITGFISGHYQVNGGSGGGASSTSLSTTATASMFSWNFTGEGDTSTYILRDNTNTKVYRITLIIGSSYTNNFISIERLY